MDLKTGLKRTSKLTFEMHLNKPLGDLGAIARDTSSIDRARTGTPTPSSRSAPGPFMFVSFTAGQRSLFKRNPNYWNGDRHYVDELE